MGGWVGWLTCVKRYIPTLLLSSSPNRSSRFALSISRRRPKSETARAYLGGAPFPPPPPPPPPPPVD